MEQATGFRGAFLHGLARVAPDVEEAKGERTQFSATSVCFLDGVWVSQGGAGRGLEIAVRQKTAWYAWTRAKAAPQSAPW